MTRDQVLSFGYKEVRQLPDGSWIAIDELIYTKAIRVGITAAGWSRSYCYDDMDALRAAFAALQAEHDEPTGWIAKRPQDDQEQGK